MKEKIKTANLTDQKLKEVLMKKALGYDCTETVEEYIAENGEIKLAKKKVTKKNVPPDLTALKLLIEKQESVSSMTDEQLSEEKARLLELLSKGTKNKKEKKIEKET